MTIYNFVPHALNFFLPEQFVNLRETRTKGGFCADGVKGKPILSLSSLHVHLLIDLAPDIAISKLVNILKTISSREIRKEFKEHLAKFYWKPVFWTSAYSGKLDLAE